MLNVQYYNKNIQPRRGRGTIYLFDSKKVKQVYSARVSELVQLKVEHVNVGYYDIYTKGGKIRRLFIPKKLQDEAQEWLSTNKRESGYLFLNRFGERITTRGIAQQLKNFAVKYGLNPKVVYPHSFRYPNLFDIQTFFILSCKSAV